MEKNTKKSIIDDGFKAELVEEAFFDGNLEIPVMENQASLKFHLE